MAVTNFCENFYTQILNHYASKNLEIALLNKDASDIMGTSLSNKTEVESYIEADQQLTSLNHELDLNEGVIRITCDNPVWNNATFDIAYAIVYETETSDILFFIDLSGEKNIVDTNFEIDFSDGLIILS